MRQLRYLRVLTLGLLPAATTLSSIALAFDHEHSQWNALLSEHVYWITAHETQIDYEGFQDHSTQLNAYLQELSGVSPGEFSEWGEAQQLAFLINAYNAFTVKLILSEYPDIDSIKDIGGLFRNPWKLEFFTLLGEERHLDWIEHEKIRVEYPEPRIHVAVNCAAIGCPALIDEAYTANDLDALLENNMRVFLSDTSRNRFNSETNQLELSKIFDWFEEDFQRGWRGWHSVADMAAQYAEYLTDNPSAQVSIREKAVDISYLSYDWSLNELK